MLGTGRWEMGDPDPDLDLGFSNSNGSIIGVLCFFFFSAFMKADGKI